jgi:hypothetical protein
MRNAIEVVTQHDPHFPAFVKPLRIGLFQAALCRGHFMSYSLTWLPDVLRAAGLNVVLIDGWAHRGRAAMGAVQGVMCHHTGGPRSGNMPTLATLINGRADLPGPLSQLGLGRDGTYYVIAAGRCNHAGVGEFRGSQAGNSRFIGIEAENQGIAADPWPAVQYQSYVRGVAAILAKLGATVDCCIGHKEFARPVGRKIDPSFDMAHFRERVRVQLERLQGRPD